MGSEAPKYHLGGGVGVGDEGCGGVRGVGGWGVEGWRGGALALEQ